ncbi:hypothetical protein SS50377_25448 [Spironucleus salmonicida]|uniref:Uncharacterized protein n=1 Tax=Spironucleus salmonicida TaxID=348837 RepID=A0A9P8LSL9_9EUKA|nr:hypothetical protein SS50377_25448 [Spironucleus salmonicida]
MSLVQSLDSHPSLLTHLQVDIVQKIQQNSLSIAGVCSKIMRSCVMTLLLHGVLNWWSKSLIYRINYRPQLINDISLLTHFNISCVGSGVVMSISCYIFCNIRDLSYC